MYPPFRVAYYAYLRIHYVLHTLCCIFTQLGAGVGLGSPNKRHKRAKVAIPASTHVNPHGRRILEEKCVVSLHYIACILQSGSDCCIRSRHRRFKSARCVKCQKNIPFTYNITYMNCVFDKVGPSTPVDPHSSRLLPQKCIVSPHYKACVPQSGSWLLHP